MLLIIHTRKFNYVETGVDIINNTDKICMDYI